MANTQVRGRTRRQKLLVVDERGRTGLDKVRTGRHTQYEVTEFPDGVLVLVPAKIVRTAEMPSAAQLTELTAAEKDG